MAITRYRAQRGRLPPAIHRSQSFKTAQAASKIIGFAELARHLDSSGKNSRS